MLEIRELTKVYPGPVPALHGIDLDIADGMFGLLGPNGAGKTTLMRVVAGLLEPTAGRVSLDGVDIVASRGTRVKAAADGYVAYVGWSPWDTPRRSFIVIIAHARGYASVYGHLQPTRLVRTGQKVKRGAAIGRVGVTGLTTGPHVHWEVHRNGTVVDALAAGG